MRELAMEEAVILCSDIASVEEERFERGRED